MSVHLWADEFQDFLEACSLQLAALKDPEDSEDCSGSEGLLCDDYVLNPKAKFGKLSVFYLTSSGCLLPFPATHGSYDNRSPESHSLCLPFPSDLWQHGQPCEAAANGTEQRSIVIGIGCNLQPLRDA